MTSANLPESATILHAGRIVEPALGMDGPGAVAFASGRVLAIGSDEHVRARMDALGVATEQRRDVTMPGQAVLAPGLVDLHAHLREPGFEAKETIRSGSEAAARGGFTTLCVMPNTDPVIDSPSTIAYVFQRAQDAPARIRPIAAISKGEAGAELSEMAALAEAGAVAFSDDGRPVANGRLMRSALEYAASLGLPIVEHCQDEELVGGGVMHEGAISTLLGLPGWPAAGEEVMLARDLALVRLTGARYHAAHLSTAGSVDLIRQAKAEGLPVTAEVTPHHLLLTDAWVAGERTGPLANALRELELTVPEGVRYDTNTKVNPPLCTAADAEALLAGLRDGTIDAVATDHAPHTQVDKACEYGLAAFGISGLETALASLLALVHTGKLTLAELIAALTVRPSRAWRLGDAGSLAEGGPADITVFTPDAEWTVEPSEMASRAKNTPLAGLTLRGRVIQTWLGGRLVYER